MTEFIDKLIADFIIYFIKLLNARYSVGKNIKVLKRVKSSPRYRFFRVISGGDLVDIDIFQYPHKTAVVISMLYYKQEHILMVSKSSTDRRTTIRLANFPFCRVKFYMKRNLTPRKYLVNSSTLYVL
ncbi:hypothetical protein UN64_11885 [Fictibacillus arsenicus]|uniref:Uncharacterized protein n=1 Tax=Fictibacillus arsenicus TaxID=255247 RepID=A0A1V3G8L7_9BACL|nr:hypothetical protein UN64_11885 [Fictibacillus arsenicus]